MNSRSKFVNGENLVITGVIQSCNAYKIGRTCVFLEYLDLTSCWVMLDGCQRRFDLKHLSRLSKQQRGKRIKYEF